jgi:hypothetical protein
LVSVASGSKPDRLVGEAVHDPCDTRQGHRLSERTDGHPPEWLVGFAIECSGNACTRHQRTPIECECHSAPLVSRNRPVGTGRLQGRRLDRILDGRDDGLMEGEIQSGRDGVIEVPPGHQRALERVRDCSCSHGQAGGRRSLPHHSAAIDASHRRSTVRWSITDSACDRNAASTSR